MSVVIEVPLGDPRPCEWFTSVALYDTLRGFRISLKAPVWRSTRRLGHVIDQETRRLSIFSRREASSLGSETIALTHWTTLLIETDFS